MTSVHVNRAPVLTLWAAVVAERLGFDHDEALTLGKAVAGATAQSKGQRLGIFTPTPAAVRRERARTARAAGTLRVALLGRAIAVVATGDGLRALDASRQPLDPGSVERYLRAKFGAALPAVREAMVALARSRQPARLADEGFALYEAFRPEVPAGRSGWGAPGTLHLEKIARLAQRDRTRATKAARAH